MVTVAEPHSLGAIQKRIERVYALPPMPELGRRLLALQSEPNASALQLARIVQLDPSLAAQVIRYANSSYYGDTGRITNIQEAIARVLGYDLVLNLALGLAAGRSFRIPDNGPLGLARFWEHAVYSAVLMQELAGILPKTVRPDSGMTYLCGLLHDFGTLLLGHLFPPEFQLLNKIARKYPQASVAELECRLLGMGQARDMLEMGHARIGAWLMQAWNMPEAVRITLLEHHNADYRGKHEVYVHLVQLVDFLLRHRADSANVAPMPCQHLDVLQLQPEQAFEQAVKVFEAEEAFTAISRLMANCS